jgi:hypothetical protein
MPIRLDPGQYYFRLVNHVIHLISLFVFFYSLRSSVDSGKLESRLIFEGFSLSSAAYQ